MRALLMVALSACGASATNVDAVIASHHHDRTIAAPTTRTLRPWLVGQWTLYKASANGEVGYVRHAIVATDVCGTWIESVAQSHHGRTVTKACYRGSPTSWADPAAELDALQAVMVREGDRTTVMDFRNGQNPNTRRAMHARLQRDFKLAWESPPSGEELTTVIVPAGRFEGVARVVSRLWVKQSMQTIETLIHPEVPLDGAIKITATDGSEQVLLDYGLTGAKSELPSLDEQRRDSAFGD